MTAAASRRRRKELLIAAGFLLPSFAGFLIFVAGPVLFSLGAGFTNWSLMRPGSTRFIGLENLHAILTDGTFWL